jgi:excinuclease ABC subunit A
LADHIIDVGLEGGKHGGEIIATGTPEELIKNKKSLTAKFLKRELGN